MLLRSSGFGSTRGYATLKDSTRFVPFFMLTYALVQTRLKAINNIGKITSSMKMIASTKLNRAQKSMEVGREYGQATVGKQ